MQIWSEIMPKSRVYLACLVTRPNNLLININKLFKNIFLNFGNENFLLLFFILFFYCIAENLRDFTLAISILVLTSRHSRQFQVVFHWDKHSQKGISVTCTKYFSHWSLSLILITPYCVCACLFVFFCFVFFLSMMNSLEEEWSSDMSNRFVMIDTVISDAGTKIYIDIWKWRCLCTKLK